MHVDPVFGYILSRHLQHISPVNLETDATSRRILRSLCGTVHFEVLGVRSRLESQCGGTEQVYRGAGGEGGTGSGRGAEECWAKMNGCG